MRLLAIIGNTIREGIARKTIVMFFILSTLTLVAMMLVAIFGKLPEINIGEGGASPEAQAMAKAGVVKGLEMLMAGLPTLAVIFLSVFATASIVPNMMEKGTIDILISKPVSRFELLFGKTAGSILIVFCNVAYFIAGIWLIISLKTGYWDGTFLLSIFTITFYFIILYSILLLIGVATQSTALSIIIVYVYIIVVAPILSQREALAAFMRNDTVESVLSVPYYILPKPGEISDITALMIVGAEIDWMPVWSSALFAVALMAFAFWLFKKKEF